MAKINDGGFNENDMNLDALFSGYGQVDETTVEKGSISRPVLWHVNGDDKLVGKVPELAQGRWAIEIEQPSDDGKKLVEVLQASPNWKEESFTFRDGPVACLVSPFIDFCEVSFRTRLVVKQGDTEVTFPSTKWTEAKALAGDKNPSSKMQQMGYLRETGQDMLVMVSTRGMVALAIRKGSANGIMAEADRRLFKVASRMAAQRAGKAAGTYCARQFYLRFGHALTPKGLPAYSVAGQGKDTTNITLPAWLKQDNTVWEGDATLADIIHAGKGLMTKDQIDVSNSDALTLQSWIAEWAAPADAAEATEMV